MTLEDHFHRYDRLNATIADLERYLQDEHSKVDKIESELQELAPSADGKDMKRKSRLAKIITEHKAVLEAAEKALVAKKKERKQLALEIQNTFLWLLDKKRAYVFKELDEQLKRVNVVTALNPDVQKGRMELDRAAEKLKNIVMNLMHSPDKQVYSVEHMRRIAVEFKLI